MSNTSERIENLSPKKRALLLQQLRAQAGQSAPTRIERRARTGEPLPLSFAQQRMWLVNQYDPGSPVDNIPAIFRLTGLLDRPALKRALDEIVRRHEALRTTFDVVDGQPWQTIAVAGRVAVPLLDLEGLTHAERAAQSLALAEARLSFDLARGPLLRVALLRLGAQEHWLLLTMHHIVADGWSMGVLFRELGALYEAFIADRPATLPELPVQYADFAHWQRDRLQGAGDHAPSPLQVQLAYWRAQLAGAPPALTLPADHPRPTAQSYQGRLHVFALPATLVYDLRSLSRQADATLFMALLAAFEVLLYRYTGQADLVVGSPIANRNHVDTEPLIGFFVNMLVLRTRLAGGLAFRALLAQVRNVTLGAYAHQDLPFEKLVEELRPERQPDRHPLVQIVFTLQNAPLPPLKLSDLTLHFGFVHNGTAKTDLSLSLTGAEHELRGEFEYNTDLFDESRIRRMARHFQALLAGGAAAPDQRLAELPLLTRAEQQQVVVEWNATGDRGQGTGDRSEEPDTWCIHRLIELQVARTPDAVAVVFEATTNDQRPTTNGNDSSFIVHRSSFIVQNLTYRELGTRANRLAWHLRALGVGPETVVGVCLERSLALVVGLLAVLKAGGAALPLDPAYPPERLVSMLDDSRAVVLITQRSIYDLRLTIDDLEESEATIVNRKSKIVNIDADWPQITQQPDTPPVSGATADNLAYVIYTSGSTGQPKGVLVPQRALMNHCLAVAGRYELGAQDRVLQFAAASFDVAAEELFPSLLRGAAVVLRPASALDSFAAFGAFLARARLTVLNVPASYWHAWTLELAATGASLPGAVRLVIVGSEGVLHERLELWRTAVGARVRWLNAYGPTEATITATLFEPSGQLEPGCSRHVAIGRPIANVQVYLLDAWLRPVPLGVPGEICIGGAGLARGYLARPDLTAARFIPNPFAEVSGAGYRVLGAESSDTRYPAPGTRLYKTGDLARYRPDGSIEFLGRADDQVKIRGYRVEPGEVEARLRRHPGVRDAVVVAREDRPGDARLVAYVVPTTDHRPPTTNDSADKETRRQGDEVASNPLVSLSPGLISQAPSFVSDLRDYLKQKLPDYMLSAAFVLLEAIPRQPSGKLDRGALPAPDSMLVQSPAPFAVPRSPVEEAIAGVWADVLKLGAGESQPAVGVYDNFFELGGHSLLATQVASRIYQLFQVELPLRAFFEAPTVAGLAQRVEQALSATALSHRPPLRALPRAGHPPLSFAQQRLWFLDQLEPGSPAYNLPTAMQLTLALDVAALACSLNEVIRRHEALRTTFQAIDGRPVQLIAPRLMLALPLLDLQALVETQRAEQARRLATQETWRPFDLARGPLLRVLLLRLGRQEHVLLLTMHHIIADGWSIEVLVRELALLYKAFAAGRPSPLPGLAIQYADYAIWQRSWLQGEVLDQALAYWRQQLEDASPAVDLPTDHAHPPTQSQRAAYHPFVLSHELTAAFRSFSRQAGVTMFMSLLAALQTLLLRYTGQEDISVGTYIANRNHAEVEALIGYFVNTLVLRMRLDDGLRDPRFREVLERVRDATLGAYAHQDLPFEKLLEALRPERRLDRTPLFQVAFVLQNVPPTRPELSGLSLSSLVTEGKRAHFDLTLWMTDEGEQLAGSLEYNADIFDPASIAGLSRCFQTLLEGIVAAPDTRLAQLALLTQAERQQLLAALHTPLASADDAPLLHQALLAQAHASPDALALVQHQQQLTYAALLGRACQLAQLLHAHGLGAEQRVGVLLERSPLQALASLACLLAGVAFVPLDPHYPPQRLATLLADSQVALLLSHSTHLATLRELLPLSCPQLCLQQLWPTLAELPPTPPPVVLDPSQLAYLIYTSGSTGSPKGVLVEQRSLRSYLAAIGEVLGLQVRDRLLQFASPSFDASVEESYPAWLVGATVVQRPPQLRAPDQAFAQMLARERLSVLSLPVAFWHAWVEELARSGEGLPKDLRLLLLNAEAPGVDRLAVWRCVAGSARVRWLNTYGPTEATVTASVYELVEKEQVVSWARVPLGVALANTQLLVLDRSLQVVPPGVVGELYLGGAGVTRGYHNQPDLTAERFVPNPFANCKLQIADCRLADPTICNLQSAICNRLYRTGDLVRYRADGGLEYLGRRDGQIKLRGYRIELGEIESVLRQHPAVREAAVLLQADRAVGQRLTAYVVQGSGVGGQGSGATTDHRPPTTDQRSQDKETSRQGDQQGSDHLVSLSACQLVTRHSSLVTELRTFLTQKLPQHMVPSSFVQLDALPRSPNGKIDQRALAAIQQDRRDAGELFVAPRTPVEAVVRGVWAAVLQRERVSVDDDFFELGGDPVLAGQVIARVNDALHIALPLRSLFENPTIAALSERIEAIRWAAQSLRSAPDLVPDDQEELEL